jgi:hypothetical protein
MRTQSGKFVRVVDSNIARNPVARQVALTKLRQSVTDTLVRSYYWSSGEIRGNEITDIATLLAVVLRVAETRKEFSTSVNVMRGAFSALVSMSSNGFEWRASDAVAITEGAQRAVEFSRTIPPHELFKAWKELNTGSCADEKA